MTKYPDVTVKLVGTDGNAFSLMGKVRKALKQAGASAEDVTQFSNEAMAGTYDDLLITIMGWVNVE